MFAGRFGPSLGALVVVASTRPVEALRAWMSRCLQWRIAWGWCGGVWHLPLFFIDGTAQARLALALFMLSVVAMSVVFAWPAHRTGGSAVAALLFHTAINFWPSVVPVLPTDTSHRAHAIVVATLVVLAVVALVTTGPLAGRAALGPMCWAGPAGAPLGGDPLPIVLNGHFPVRGDRSASP